MQHSPASDWPGLDGDLVGRPLGDQWHEWINHGARRFRNGVIAGLLCSWSVVWLAVWIGTAAAILGAIVGLIAFAQFPILGQTTGGGLFGLIVGAAGGFVVGFTAIYGADPTAIIANALVGIFIGIIVAAVIVLFAAFLEPWSIHLRGYRRMSRREAERVEPLVTTVLESLGYQGRPQIAIHDDAVPMAWAYSRYLVLTAGLLEMDDDELAGILAHELHHWHSGTAVGLRFAWACSLPLAIMYDLGAWIAGGSPEMDGRAIAAGLPSPAEHARTVQNKSVAVLIGWFFLWPSWLLIRFVIAPVIGMDSRRDEYQADCAAANAGHADGLYRALETLTTFERGRTGWEGAMCATHPPTELRLEHLEQHLGEHTEP